MTIYVDDAGIPAAVHNHQTGRVVTSTWSHLISDQLDPTELHDFATKTLGLRRSYFQPGCMLGRPDQHNPGGDHYDLTAGKRKQALAKGATPISATDLAAIARLKNTAHRLPDCGYAITQVNGHWVCGLEWGSEADDSPMAGAAAYGTGETAWDAIEAALQETNPA